MRASRTAPTGVERRFGDDELIVTKTDPRGVITYANEVFLRVSALTEAEIVGQPHNIIRHPGMPRGVFDLLWETLRSGSEMFAYVVNLAADGAHYWVLAHVTPSVDAHGKLLGYHSNRRVPEPAAVAAVRRLYDELLAVEARHSRPADAVKASRAALAAQLAAAGQTYEEFVWSLTPEGAAA
ncbi:PAS domain-containing protein [Kineococcus sp. NPDC059986]|uniref:PAS domain-containing protein n=1 Tax=Kineococcus sp. NPDC059986 TaxID=3155538 RepID=UPI00344F0899